jgi:hypothetical protein
MLILLFNSYKNILHLLFKSTGAKTRQMDLIRIHAVIQLHIIQILKLFLRTRFLTIAG